MPKINSRGQLSFTKSSEKAIRKDYGIAQEDEILLAVWFTDDSCSIWRRQGFIFTRNGLAWNHRATAENTDSADGMKELAPRNKSFLAKQDVTFLGTSLLSSEEAGRQDCKAEIQLRTSGTLYTFIFDSGIPKEKLSDLERAIAAHFSDALDTESLAKKDAAYSLDLTILAIRDFFVHCYLAIQEKLSETRTNQQNQKQNRKDEREKRKSEKTSSTVQRPRQKKSVLTGHFIRHVVDFCTDLLLILAVVIFVKPQLLEKPLLLSYTNSIGEWSLTFWLSARLPPTDEALAIRNVIFFLLGISWIVLKILISFTCHRNRKAVTLLLIIMLLAATLIISDEFLVYAILLLLILLALQFSMGFSADVVQFKSILFIICCITGYIVIHLVLMPELSAMIGEAFRFPAHWW